MPAKEAKKPAAKKTRKAKTETIPENEFLKDIKNEMKKESEESISTKKNEMKKEIEIAEIDSIAAKKVETNSEIIENPRVKKTDEAPQAWANECIDGRGHIYRNGQCRKCKEDEK